MSDRTSTQTYFLVGLLVTLLVAAGSSLVRTAH
jgi:hypothetical protein